MTLVDGKVRAAMVQIPFGHTVTIVELLAHEFEHILEQLDGVDLAALGRPQRRRTRRRIESRTVPFETERARAGRTPGRRRIPVRGTPAIDGPQGAVMSWLVLAVGWLLWRDPPEVPPCERPAGRPAAARTGARGAASRPTSAPTGASWRSSRWRDSPQPTSTRSRTSTSSIARRRAITLESADRRSAAPPTGSSQQPRLSGDGRVLVFSTLAAEPGRLARRRRRLAGAAPRSRHAARRRSSRTRPAGTPGNGWSGGADVSDDGRYVVFESRATDLVAGPDANHGGSDIYLFDAADGAIRRVSVTDAGEQSAAGQSSTPAISGNGRFVAFSSTAPIDAPARRPVGSPGAERLRARPRHRRHPPHQRQRGGGGMPNGASYHPAISGDGRRIAFVSTATDLDADLPGPPPQEHLYLHDADTGRLRLAQPQPVRPARPTAPAGIPR